MAYRKFSDTKPLKVLACEDLCNSFSGSLHLNRITDDDFYDDHILLRNKLLRLEYEDDILILPSRLYEIADILRRYIEAVPRRIQQTTDFVKDIHCKLLFLHEHSCRNDRIGEQFRQSRQLQLLLIRYIELEYEVLYCDNGRRSPEYQKQIEKRVLSLLLISLDSSRRKMDKHTIDRTAINALYTMRSVKTEYKRQHNFIENIMGKLLVKLNVMSHFNEMKKKHEVLTLDKLLQVPQVQKLHEHLHEREYMFVEEDVNSLEEDELLDDTVEVAPPIKEEIKTEPSSERTVDASPFTCYNGRRKVMTIDLADEDEDCYIVYFKPEVQKEDKKDRTILLLDNFDNQPTKTKLCSNSNINSDRYSNYSQLNDFSTSTYCDTIKGRRPFEDSDDSVCIIDDDSDSAIEIFTESPSSEEQRSRNTTPINHPEESCSSSQQNDEIKKVTNKKVPCYSDIEETLLQCDDISDNEIENNDNSLNICNENSNKQNKVENVVDSSSSSGFEIDLAKQKSIPAVFEQPTSENTETTTSNFDEYTATTDSNVSEKDHRNEPDRNEATTSINATSTESIKENSDISSNDYLNVLGTNQNDSIVNEEFSNSCTQNYINPEEEEAIAEENLRSTPERDISSTDKTEITTNDMTSETPIPDVVDKSIQHPVSDNIDASSISPEESNNLDSEDVNDTVNKECSSNNGNAENVNITHKEDSCKNLNVEDISVTKEDSCKNLNAEDICVTKEGSCKNLNVEDISVTKEDSCKNLNAEDISITKEDSCNNLNTEDISVTHKEGNSNHSNTEDVCVGEKETKESSFDQHDGEDPITNTSEEASDQNINVAEEKHQNLELVLDNNKEVLNEKNKETKVSSKCTQQKEQGKVETNFDTTTTVCNEEKNNKTSTTSKEFPEKLTNKFTDHNCSNSLDVLASVAAEQQKMEGGELKQKKGKRGRKPKKKPIQGKANNKNNEEIIEKRVTRSSLIKNKVVIPTAVSKGEVQDNLQCLPSTFMDLGNLVTPPPICVYNMIVGNVTDNDESLDEPFNPLQTPEVVIKHAIFDEDTIEDGIILITHKRMQEDNNCCNKEVVISIPETTKDYSDIHYEILKQTEEFVAANDFTNLKTSDTDKLPADFSNIFNHKNDHIEESPIQSKNDNSDVCKEKDDNLLFSKINEKDKIEESKVEDSKGPRSVPVKKRRNYCKTNFESIEENVNLKSTELMEVEAGSIESKSDSETKSLSSLDQCTIIENSGNPASPDDKVIEETVQAEDAKTEESHNTTEDHSAEEETIPKICNEPQSTDEETPILEKMTELTSINSIDNDENNTSDHQEMPIIDKEISEDKDDDIEVYPLVIAYEIEAFTEEIVESVSNEEFVTNQHLTPTMELPISKNTLEGRMRTKAELKSFQLPNNIMDKSLPGKIRNTKERSKSQDYHLKHKKRNGRSLSESSHVKEESKSANLKNDLSTNKSKNNLNERDSSQKKKRSAGALSTDTVPKNNDKVRVPKQNEKTNDDEGKQKKLKQKQDKPPKPIKENHKIIQELPLFAIGDDVKITYIGKNKKVKEVKESVNANTDKFPVKEKDNQKTMKKENDKLIKKLKSDAKIRKNKLISEKNNAKILGSKVVAKKGKAIKALSDKYLKIELSGKSYRNKYRRISKPLRSSARSKTRHIHNDMKKTKTEKNKENLQSPKSNLPHIGTSTTEDAKPKEDKKETTNYNEDCTKETNNDTKKRSCKHKLLENQDEICDTTKKLKMADSKNEEGAATDVMEIKNIDGEKNEMPTTVVEENQQNNLLITEQDEPSESGEINNDKLTEEESQQTITNDTAPDSTHEDKQTDYTINETNIEEANIQLVEEEVPLKSDDLCVVEENKIIIEVPETSAIQEIYSDVIEITTTDLNETADENHSICQDENQEKEKSIECTVNEVEEVVTAKNDEAIEMNEEDLDKPNECEIEKPDELLEEVVEESKTYDTGSTNEKSTENHPELIPVEEEEEHKNNEPQLEINTTEEEDAEFEPINSPEDLTLFNSTENTEEIQHENVEKEDANDNEETRCIFDGKQLLIITEVDDDNDNIHENVEEETQEIVNDTKTSTDDHFMDSTPEDRGSSTNHEVKIIKDSEHAVDVESASCVTENESKVIEQKEAPEEPEGDNEIVEEIHQTDQIVVEEAVVEAIEKEAVVVNEKLDSSNCKDENINNAQLVIDQELNTDIVQSNNNESITELPSITKTEDLNLVSNNNVIKKDVHNCNLQKNPTNYTNELHEDTHKMITNNELTDNTESVISNYTENLKENFVVNAAKEHKTHLSNNVAKLNTFQKDDREGTVINSSMKKESRKKDSNNGTVKRRDSKRIEYFIENLKNKHSLKKSKKVKVVSQPLDDSLPKFLSSEVKVPIDQSEDCQILDLSSNLNKKCSNEEEIKLIESKDTSAESPQTETSMEKTHPVQNSDELNSKEGQPEQEIKPNNLERKEQVFMELDSTNVVEIATCEVPLENNFHIHEEIVTDEPSVNEVNNQEDFTTPTVDKIPLSTENREENETNLNSSVITNDLKCRLAPFFDKNNPEKEEDNASLAISKSSSEQTASNLLEETNLFNKSESLMLATASLKCVPSPQVLEEMVVPNTIFEETVINNSTIINDNKADNEHQQKPYAASLFEKINDLRVQVPAPLTMENTVQQTDEVSYNTSTNESSTTGCEISDNLFTIISKVYNAGNRQQQSGNNKNDFIFLQGTDHNYHSLTTVSDPLLGGAGEGDIAESDHSSDNPKEITSEELGDDDNILSYIPTLSENNLNQELSNSLNESSVDNSTDFQLQLEQCLIGNSLVGRESSPPLPQIINCDNLYQTTLKQEVLEYEDNSEFSENMNEFMNVLTNIQKLNNMAKSTPRQDSVSTSSFQLSSSGFSTPPTSQFNQNLDSSYNFVHVLPEFPINTSCASNMENSVITDVPEMVSFDFTNFYYLPVTHDSTSLNTNIYTSKKVIVEPIPQNLEHSKPFVDMNPLNVTSAPLTATTTTVDMEKIINNTNILPPKQIEVSPIKAITNNNSSNNNKLPTTTEPDRLKESQISVGFVRTSSRTRVSAPRPKKPSDRKNTDESSSSSSSDEHLPKADESKMKIKVPIPEGNAVKLKVRSDLGINMGSLSKGKSLYIIEDSAGLNGSTKVQPSDDQKTETKPLDMAKKLKSNGENLQIAKPKNNVQKQEETVPSATNESSVQPPSPQKPTEVVPVSSVKEKEDSNSTPTHSDMIDNVKRRKRKPVDYSSIEKLLEIDEYEYYTYKAAQQKYKHRKEDTDEWYARSKTKRKQDTSEKSRSKTKLSPGDTEKSKSNLPSNETQQKILDDSDDSPLKSSKASKLPPSSNNSEKSKINLSDSKKKDSIFEDSDDDVPKKKKPKQDVRSEPDMNALFDKLVKEGNVNNVSFKPSKKDAHNVTTPTASTAANTGGTSNAHSITTTNLFNLETKKSDNVTPVKQIGVVNPIPRPNNTLRKEPPLPCPNRNSYGNAEDSRGSNSYYSYYPDRSRRSYPHSSRENRELIRSSHQSSSSRRTDYQSHSNDPRYSSSSQRSSSSSKSSSRSSRHHSSSRSSMEQRNYRYASPNDLAWREDLKKKLPHMFKDEVIF